MENGPATGSRTSASGNSRFSRRPTSSTMAIRPSRSGSNGFNCRPSSSDDSNG